MITPITPHGPVLLKRVTTDLIYQQTLFLYDESIDAYA